MTDESRLKAIGDLKRLVERCEAAELNDLGHTWCAHVVGMAHGLAEDLIEQLESWRINNRPLKPKE